MDTIQKDSATLVELLNLRSKAHPDKTAFVFLEEGERESGRFSYGELQIRAQAIASVLQSKNLRGERALLIYESGLDYIDSFFGCLCADVISVPLHPPGKNKSLSRISAIAKDSGAKVILATSEIRQELENEFVKDDVLKNLEWITTDEISNDFAADFRKENITPKTLAYLQYTSGSTGIPKGVMVNHQNLIHNINIIDKSHPHDDSSVMVTWLPIHHDMGLIYGMLLPFVCGYPCYFMTPQAFVRKPFRWLDAISKYKGTHNAAPNFAFELCVNKVSEEQMKNLDLSSWVVAMNAAEPVRSETMLRFAEKFEPCGFELKYFAPGYGLAEGTLILSTTFKEQMPVMRRFDDNELEKNNKALDADENDALSKVHAGHFNSIEDTRIAIVNPVTLVECKEGEVGEVWASGISIAQGYWQREDATNETFRAYISDTGEGPFLRTGDLGFIKDNELYITGRHKDLIIIRGQNHYPQDIEYTVEASHPALRLGCVAAYSYEDDGEEHIGIVQEIQKNFANDFNADEVVKAIRKSVSLEHDLQISAVTLIAPGTVPKTSSGKIQRSACRRGVAEQTLEVLAQWDKGELTAGKLFEKKEEGSTTHTLTAKNLTDWLVNRLAQMMQIKKESIDITEPFAIYGMDSLKAVQLSGDLEELLQKELPSTLVYDYPNIRSLAQYLSSDESKFEQESIAADSTDKHDVKESVAIIGIGLRFPDADNVNEFWKNLVEGRDSIREIPEGRWSKDQLKDTTVTYGGFVNDVDKFDPVFFGISPREAIQIDPQQRFTLEVAWQALEDAGINPDSLAGGNTGVFIGICTYDYSRFSSGRKNLFDVYTGTGTSLSIAANRISYILDLRGPSVAVDTACSSSLVALHLACQSIRSGQSSIAIAGGVNLLLAPDWNVVFTEADMLASDGRCKTFDERADGYVRSEGCGIVILKKLSDAIKDGDRIYSVIRGSAINQDGRSNGLTAPNGPSQEAVIAAALADADVKPNEVNYLETHGTGTPLGDPIEVNSLTKVITKERSPENICYIGSVKTNIGHLEAAAGIAGVIKTSLALHNNEIPKHIHFKRLNSEIAIGGKPIKIANENVEWKGDNRIAGVSSFGFGGTNAHVVISSAPKNTVSKNLKNKPLNIFTLSAKNENVLNTLAKNYLGFLNDNPDVRLADVCYMANAGRTSHSHRVAISCSSTDELKQRLAKLVSMKGDNHIKKSVVRPNHFPKTAFLFPGQGAQFIGMGKELYDTHPLFRNIINRCDEILRSYLDKPLLEVLFYEKDEKLNPINETTFTQPAQFAIEYALAKLWMSWGIIPDLMMGHSAGELVAACLAGVFSLEDGLKLATERGRLMQTMTGDGEMYTIFADEQTVKKAISGFETEVSVASINSPVKTVISGDKTSLSKIIPAFEKDKVEYKKINVSIASHSPLMKTMLEEFRKVCREIKYSKPAIPVVSNITGEIVTDRISNPDYWCDHIMSTVRFSEGIIACVNHGINFFVDLGPKPTSIGMAQETVSDSKIHWLPSIKYNFSIWETMLQGLSELYVNGADIHWENFDKDFAHNKISIPVYPFQKNRYWIEDEYKDAGRFGFAGDDSKQPLAGSKVITASENEIIFNSVISANNPDYLNDHRVFGKVIFPGAAYVEIALEVYGRITGESNVEAENVKFVEAMMLKADEVRIVQTILTGKERDEYSFKIYSMSGADNNGVWTLHSFGDLKKTVKELKDSVDILSVRNSFENQIDPSRFYEKVSETGVEYGKRFQGISELNVGTNGALSKIHIGKDIHQDKYKLHPILLDSAFQTGLALILKEKNEKAFIPVSIRKVEVGEISEEDIGNDFWCYVELVDSEKQGSVFPKIHRCVLKIFSDKGKLIASVGNLELREAGREEFSFAKDELKDWFYNIEWKETYSDTNGLVSVNALARDLSRSMNEFDTRLSSYKNDIDKIEKVGLKLIFNVFEKLGYKLEKGMKFNIDEVASRLKIESRHGKLFRRMIEILKESELIKIESDNCEVIKTVEINPADDRLEEMLTENYLLDVCGRNLDSVLTGRADPLELLFPGGDSATVMKLYKDSPAFEIMNKSIASAVKNILANKHGQVRILEIGAGTGSTSEAVLHASSGKEIEYFFTDVSASFFHKARERFKDSGNIVFKILDIEKNPEMQGFNAGTFDIIIASNVIHATKDLRETVSGIKDLLKNEGILILNEVTERKNWIDLTFGMTEGWWRFKDFDLRKDYPLLSPDEWKTFLSNEGLDDVEVLPVSNAAQSIIIASRIISGDVKSVKNGFHIVIADDSSKSEIENSGNSSEMKFIAAGDSEQLTKSISDMNALDDDKVNLIYVCRSRILAANADITDFDDSCIAILDILKEISAQKLSKKVSLTIVTENAVSVNSNDALLGISNSAVRGMAKVIRLEHPEYHLKIIDIESIADFRLVLNCVGLTDDDGENQIAFRGGKRFVPRLKRRSVRNEGELKIDIEGTYLITGGTGGLGLVSAKYLADKGAKHILLLGRSGISEAGNHIIDELKVRGVDVRFYKADIAEKSDAERVINEISDSKHPLKGIIHSAGVLDDAALLNQTKKKFENVLRPKILGAWNLHELTKDLSIDFFVMYSSVASVLGSAGQANHSSANAFLDALAYYRRSKNLPAVSINWGVWSEIGSAAAKGADRKEKIAGIGNINPSRGVSALDVAMKIDEAQLIIVPIDWSKFAETNSDMLTDELMSTDFESGTGSESVSIAEDFILQLSKAKPEEYSGILTEYFQNLISRIMGLEPEDFDIEQPLNTMGLDSLMAIELKNKVNIELGVDLNLVRYMEETSIIHLAQELKEQLPRILSKTSSSANEIVPHEISEVERARELLANIDNLTEEELDRLLNETK